ncbi:MAG TPA: bifunctional 4-hydroxy-2-oxoglutarate aldolase/2-dehydro-3-deoxy-phosphogluconate aldolase [Anaerolineae bacterium]|nr:bifunctional 4-hydroxy-2-oxoglutarate aldolase/2-dehydro-3-deoxy-phosphogluconate aldolase [Anaerolineae bacterium]
MPSPTAEQVLDTIRIGGVIAIVRLADLSAAVPLSHALLSGGVTALEFTLTNPEALKVMPEVKAAIPELAKGQAVIGMGTVLDADMARASIEAGAQFVVSPTTDFDTIEICRRLDMTVIPGALTPTEILKAWKAGATAVKVFPARSVSPAYVKDVREPLPFLRLIPTGGIDLENAGAYIRHGAFAVGVGGNLVDKRLIAAGDRNALTAKAAAYVQAVRLARG